MIGWSFRVRTGADRDLAAGEHRHLMSSTSSCPAVRTPCSEEEQHQHTADLRGRARTATASWAISKCSVPRASHAPASVRIRSAASCSTAETVLAPRVGKPAEPLDLVMIRICTCTARQCYLQPLALSSVCKAMLPVCSPGSQLVAPIVDEAVNDARDCQDTADDSTC